MATLSGIRSPGIEAPWSIIGILNYAGSEAEPGRSSYLHEGDDIRDMREAMINVREKVSALEVRCGIFGAVAGMVSYLVAHLLRTFGV